MNVIMGLREVEQRMTEADSYMDVNENEQASDKTAGDGKNETRQTILDVDRKGKGGKEFYWYRNGEQAMKKDSLTYADSWLLRWEARNRKVDISCRRKVTSFRMHH